MLRGFVLIATEEFTADLGNCMCRDTMTVPCLWPVTDIVKLKIYLVEVGFWACEIVRLTFCDGLYGQSSAKILLYICYRRKKLTNGNQCKGHVVIQTRVFYMICTSSPRPLSRVLEDSIHAVKVNYIFFRNEQYKGTTVSATCTASILRIVDSSWNVMAHGDAREGKWRGIWRMELVASTLHTTSEHGVSSITTADAHTSATSSRLNWRPPRRFQWTRPFRRKTKSGFCACAITFQRPSTYITINTALCLIRLKSSSTPL